MVKKIFAIIGIVLGSVTAFVGAVAGVLALQGKFKTPQVYPKVLSFENSEQVVVSVAENAKRGNEIFSYKLSATNEDNEYPINHKTCYVWFVDNIGADLIELCDEDGNALVSQNGRYQINANELAYYKVKNNVNDLEYVEGSNNNGKVVLQARSENDKVQSNQLTIWIDRQIDEIYLVDSQKSPVLDDKGIQNVQVGSGKSLAIDFLVNPEIARRPISIENPKEIELYFCDALRSGFDFDDYIKVDETSVANNEALKKLFYYENNQLMFKSDESDTYSFKITVFKSYASKTNFSANPGFANLKNYDKLGKTDYLTVQDLKIEVVNSTVDSVTMVSTSVVLNLFSQNDYITLNGNSGISGAKENNLEIAMFDSNGEPTNVRYNEVTFGNDFEQLLVDMRYEYLQADNGDKLSDANIGDDVIFGGVQYSDVYLDVNKRYNIVEKINVAGNSYSCTNGACVYDTKERRLRLLSSGSYLDFYVKNGIEHKLLNGSEFFDIKRPINSLGNKSWNVIAKKALELQVGESLEIAILVVNSEGKFDFDSLFSGSPVVVAETDLSYELNSNNYELAMIYDNAAVDSIRFSELKFEDIVSILAGTYDNCVFVTENKDGNVDVIEQITYTVDDGVEAKTYYLVGYIENEKFVNRVRIKAGEDVKKDSFVNIYMLQLINDYPYDVNGSKISTEDYITKEFISYKLKEGDTEFELDASGNKILNEKSISNVKKLYSDTKDAITIKPTYNLTNFELKFEYKDKVHYETIEDKYQLQISAERGNNGILEKIFKFYELDSNLEYFYSSNSVVQIMSVSNDVDGLLVMFNTGARLSNPDAEIYINFNCAGINLECGPIYVRSISPEKIVFNYAKDDDTEKLTGIELSDSANSVDDKAYINIEIDWKSGEYEETWTLIESGDKLSDLSSGLFNLSSLENSIGFQDETWKGKSLNISYESGDVDIFTIDGGNFKLNKVGSTYLKVQIGETYAYIKINIEASENFKFIDKNLNEVNNRTKFTSTQTPTDLNSLINLCYYDGSYNVLSQQLIAVKYNGINGYNQLNQDATLKFEDGTLYEVVVENVDDVATETRTGIVEIKYDEIKGTWEITRLNNLYITFTLQLTLNTLVCDLTIELELSSSLNVQENENWNDDIYQGTTVQVYEAVYGGAEFGKESLVRIKSDNVISNLEISYTIGSSKDKVTLVGESLKFEKLDKYTFYVSINGVKIREFIFQVIPNVIVEWKLEKFTSDTDYAYSDMFTLYQMKTKEAGATIVYGSSKDNIYNSDYRAEFTDYSSISFSSVGEDKKTILKSSTAEGKNINTGWIEEIGRTRIETLTIKTNVGTGDANYVEISKKDIEISNKYNDVIISTNKNKTYALMAMINIEPSDLFTLDSSKLSNFALSDVKWGSESIFDNENKKIKFNALSQEQENVQLIFEYLHEDDGRKVVYATGDDVDITINPYCLGKENKKAYSETDFDLLSDVFNTTNLGTAIEPIKSFIITGIYDQQEGGTYILRSIIEGGELSSAGYVAGTINKSCLVKFNAISGDSITIWVEYKIAYTDDQTEYVFREELTIENKHSIDLKYPQQDETLTIDPTTFVFMDNETERLNFLNQSKTADGMYSKVNFEPINIYSSSSTTLRFDIEDEILLMNRVLVNDRTDGNKEIKTNISVALVGYVNVVNFANYLNNISINESAVTFGPTSINGLYGYVVLKITITSGNYKYYIVRVQHNTNMNIDSANELIVDGVNGKNFSNLISEERVLTKFEEVLKVNYEDVKGNLDAYILSATSIDENKTFGYNLNSRVYSAYDTDKDGKNIDAEIEDFTSYTTITLNLIYRSGNYNIYPIGKLTFILKPSVSETVISLVTNPDGLDDGVYKCALKNDKQDINVDNLFTVSGTFKSTTILTEGIDKDVVDTEGRILQIKNYSSEQLNFVVEYKYEIETGKYFVLKVYYTLEALKISNTISTQTVGVFDVDDKEFKNTIALSKIFNGYNGGVIICDGNGKDVTSDYYVPSTRSLTFKQTNTLYEVLLNFELKDIKENGDIVNRQVKFAIQPGVKMLWSNTGVGQTSGNRLLTTATGDFKISEGSKISILKSEDKGVYKFEFKGSGLTVYTAGYDMTLRFSKEDVQYDNQISYVRNFVDGSKVKNSDTLSIARGTGTDNINLVHLPSARDMQIEIEVGDSSTILFFTAVATYGGIESVYIINDASYENVKMNTSIEGIYAHLFTNKIAEAVEKTNKTQITNSYRVNVFELLAEGATTPKSITNFDGIGFNDTTNPNRIKFTVGQGSPIAINGDNATFETVNNAKKSSIYLNNETGIKNIEYIFQILPVDDGIDFSTCSGIAGNHYVSYSYNIDKNIKSYGKETVGSLLDPNGYQFYITKLEFNGKDVTLTRSNNGTEKIYSFTDADFEFNITFDAGIIKTELKRIDTKKESINKFDIKFTAYGSGGQIISDFHILFYNYDIVDNYASTQDLTNYAGYEIDLTSGVRDNNTEGKTLAKIYLSDATLKLDLVKTNNESYYQIGSQRIYVTSDSNDLFTFNTETRTLTLEPVGENVSVSLTFLVKEGNYGIKKVKYNLVVNRNLQFMVNGDYETNTNGYLVNRTEFETDFILTNKDGSKNGDGNFSIEKEFKASINESDKSGTKHKSLVFNIYRIRDQYNANVGKASNKAVLSNSNVQIAEMGNLVKNGIITIDGNNSITFNQDYTGDINLMLIVRTNNGEYQVEWIIHVTGILTLEYTLADPETTAVQNSGAPFKSLSEVYLINGLESVGKGVGIIASEDGTFKDSYIDRESKTIGLKYVIIKTSELTGTMADMFNKGKSQDAAINWNNDNLRLKTTLPLVESSDPNSPQYYYVIYEISITHLGKTRVFYVAYQVVNYKTVTPNSSYTDVNVNSALDNTTQLNLFYYSETYKNSDGTKITVTYEDGKFKTTGGSGFTIDETNRKVKYETEDCTFVSKSVAHDNGTIHSMFISNFNNIFEFKDYICEIGSVQIGLKSFTLTHIADGRWGINLAENGEFFSNELSADLKIVSNGATIDSIPARSNNVGFRLFTDKTISAKNEVPLSSIFTSSNCSDKSALSLNIIGINISVEGSTDWVNNASSCNVSDDSVATFNVPTGDGNNTTTYTLFKIQYKSTSGGLTGVCDLVAEFYAIKCGGATISVIDYYSSGLASSDYIQVNYIEGQEDQKLDMSKTFKVYSMDEGIIVDSYVKDPSITYENSSITAITKSSSDLQKFKNENPTAKSYTRGTYTATFGGKTVEFNVQFALPSNPTIETNQTASDWSIDLKSTDYSTTFKLNVNGGQSISLDNISAYVTEVVVDSGSSYYATVNVDAATGKWDGTIRLNASEIGKYFVESPTLSLLKLEFTVAMKYEGSTIMQTFNIVVRKPAS